MTDLSVLTQPDDGVNVEKAAPEDLRLWSVTTIIDVLDKPALLYWAAEQSAIAAVRIAGSLPARLEEDGEAEVIKWLRDARWRRPKDALSATALGTVAHRCFELWTLTGTRPGPDEIRHVMDLEGGGNFVGHANELPTVTAMLDQFGRGFLDKFQPSYHAAEVTVFHPDYGYAGTLDAIAEVHGSLQVIDYKTSRKSVDGQGKPTGPYPEVALQLAAYRHAPLAAVWRPRRFEQYRRRYYLLGPDERSQAVATPDVEGGLCIHVTPEHCTVHPVRCGPDTFRYFLYVLECSRWDNLEAKTAILDPLE